MTHGEPVVDPRQPARSRTPLCGPRLGFPRWSVVIGGYLLALAAGWGYGSVVRAGGEWNQGAAWERALLVQLHSGRAGWLDTLLYLIPWAGTNLSLGPLVAVLAAWLLWRRRRDLAMWVVVVELGVLSLNWLIKHLLERERPHLFERVGWFGWASYPSGHVMSSLAVLTTLALLVRYTAGHRWPLPAALITCGVIAYSRLVHGVHWPTDLIGGALTGIVWLGATWLAFVKLPAVPAGDEQRST